MAETGIYCTRQEVLEKAGANVAAASGAETFTNSYIAQVESFINVATRKNWSDSYASLNVDVKKILSECCSNLTAIYAISYDMSAYPSRADAELMMKVLYKRAMDCLKMLMDQKMETFMTGA